MKRRGYSVFIDSFTEGLEELPRKKQRDIVEVLRTMEANPRKRFSVFEATANQTIAVTMTRICQEGYVETDNSCGYPWTKYKLTAKGLEAIKVPACP